MLNLAKVIKPWKEAGSLNANLSLYGFWNDTTTLTKRGDLMMILRASGVDYESLDSKEQNYAVRRFESALSSFGEGFRVYQYLFKTNRPSIPCSKYNDELIDSTVEQRQRFFESKRDDLYSVEIFYAIVLQGQGSEKGILPALKRSLNDPAAILRDLRAQFSGNAMKTLLRVQIDADAERLRNRVEGFTRQLADFMPMQVLNHCEQFTFFRRLLNFDDWRIAGKPKADHFLDFQISNSNIEAETEHLRIGEHYTRILTMKEAPSETKPLILRVS